MLGTRGAMWVTLATLTLPLGLRVGAMILDGSPLGLADLRGLASELVAAAVWTWLLLQALRVPGAKGWIGRGLAGLLFFVWGATAFANFEHVLANDANIDPANFKYLGDPAFVEGSALRATHPVLLGVLVAAAVLLFGYGLYRKPQAPRRGVGWLVVAVAAVFALPVDEARPRWRQEAATLGLARLTAAGAGGVAPVTGAYQGVARALAADLSGEPRFVFPQFERPPNILIVMMEGITGGYIPALAAKHGVTLPVKMPKLSALAEAHVAAATVVAHQRQTDRGEYTLLCGDLPKLSRTTPKMTDVAQRGPTRRCLPDLLRARGYQTVYLQPAPMAFMLKDQFMAKVGFDDSRGADFFQQGYEKGGWGIDDKAFFEQSLAVLEEKHAKGPWMAALMTVGTHHPLLVPQSFPGPKDEDEFARAARYTDEALDQLIAGLRAKGMLANTVVIVTSDEARGIHEEYEGITRTISQNWGFVVALLPKGERAMITEPVALSDVALSLLDYTGQTDGAAELVGRSLFRRYPMPRAIAFANIFQRRAFYLDEALGLTICPEDFRGCRQFSRDDAKVFGPGWRDGGRDRSRRLQQVVAWSALDTREARSGGASLVQLNKGLVPITRDSGWGMYLFGGQFLYADAGQKAVVDVDVEVEGEGAVVQLSSELNVEYEDRYKVPELPPLFEGDRLRLRYSYTQPGPLKRVDAEMFAKRLLALPTRLIVHRAEVRFVPLAEGEDEAAGAALELLEVSRRDGEGLWHPLAKAPRETTRDSVFAAPSYRFRPCVQRDAGGALRAVGCQADRVVLGPYRHAPPKSLANARYRVRITDGKGQAWVNLVSRWGRVRHRTGVKLAVEAGQEVELKASAHLADVAHGLEAQLEIKPEGKSTLSFEVLEGELTVTPR
ncbi:MAG: LTA synthase family protein [Myxococcales bacterium]|nr:LTA synthase family protein [Myxococcales bacterium]